MTKRDNTTEINPDSNEVMDNQGLAALLAALEEQGVTSPSIHGKVKEAGFTEDECSELLNALSDEDDED